ncbi:hypothetical protein PIB30_038209 [Stylosanthes scabra]|uniref:Uncharacterized protein n=1 Tax=Stylosanthes scabra TaxID=79078 RepID=A0ABU6SDT4_9FABA|nr:hypothetical protein [Stylosanthes scabra]
MSLRSQTPKTVSVSLQGASPAHTSKNDTLTDQNVTTIPSLVSELRATILTPYFDRVESALHERESCLLAAIKEKDKEIESLIVKESLHRLDKLNLESQLKNFRNGRAKVVVEVNKEENVGSDCMHCLELKNEVEKEKVLNDSLRVRNMLLETIKSALEKDKKEWDDQRGFVEDLMKRNTELEAEKIGLLKEKEQWDDQRGFFEGLRGFVKDLMKRYTELEAEKVGLLKEKKKWDDAKGGIDGFREEVCRAVATDEASVEYLKTKFIELSERVSRLERETAENEKLISLDEDGGGGGGDGSKTEENNKVQVDDSVEKEYALKRNRNVGVSSRDSPTQVIPSKDGGGVTGASDSLLEDMGKKCHYLQLTGNLTELGQAIPVPAFGASSSAQATGGSVEPSPAVGGDSNIEPVMVVVEEEEQEEDPYAALQPPKKRPCSHGITATSSKGSKRQALKTSSISPTVQEEGKVDAGLQAIRTAFPPNFNWRGALDAGLTTADIFSTLVPLPSKQALGLAYLLNVGLEDVVTSSELKKQLQDVRERVELLEAQRDSAMGQLKVMENRAQSLSDELHAYLESSKTIETEMKQLEKQNQTLRSDLASAKKSLEEAATDKKALGKAFVDEQDKRRAAEELAERRQKECYQYLELGLKAVEESFENVMRQGRKHKRAVKRGTSRSGTTSRRSAKTTFTDILKQLAKRFYVDLTPRTASIKIMVQEEMAKLADEADEEEDEEDAEKGETQPAVQEVET